MILLLGGTSETAPLVEKLVEAGFSVLVSTATDTPLELPVSENVTRRTGPLDEARFAGLIAEHGIRAIVDATHPYATQVTELAAKVAKACGVPSVIYNRPPTIKNPRDWDRTNLDGTTTQIIYSVKSHEEAAKVATELAIESANLEPCNPSFLLTTGSRNLEPYVCEAKKHGAEVFARVLPEESSISACKDAGLDQKHIIAKRGPFTVLRNCHDLRMVAKSYVLVAKDSGEAGGTLEKVDCCWRFRWKLVLISRPDLPTGVSVFEDMDELVEKLAE